MGIGVFAGREEGSTMNPYPNPHPGRWKLLEKKEYANGYVLKVKYEDCTNYEGVKIMVYKGQYFKQDYLDPHFTDNGYSPFARFKPTDEGWIMACTVAQHLV